MICNDLERILWPFQQYFANLIGIMRNDLQPFQQYFANLMGFATILNSFETIWKHFYETILSDITTLWICLFQETSKLTWNDIAWTLPRAIWLLHLSYAFETFISERQTLFHKVTNQWATSPRLRVFFCKKTLDKGYDSIGLLCKVFLSRTMQINGFKGQGWVASHISSDVKQHLGLNPKFSCLLRKGF